MDIRLKFKLKNVIVINILTLFPLLEMGHWSVFQYRIFLSSKAKIGYIVIILSAVFTGLVNSVAKPLIDAGDFPTIEISPIMLAVMIYLINALFFTTLTKNSTSIKSIGRRNMFFLAIIGIAEVSALITYFFGLKDSTAINASILSEGEMIFSLLIAITVMRERLQRKELTPFAMIVVGMIIIPVGIDLYENGFEVSDLVFGDALILLSGLFYALDINLCKLLSRKMDSRRLIQLTSLFSGIFALGLVAFFNIPFNIDWSQIPSIVFLSIVGTGIASVFFIIALRLIGAIRTLLLYSSSAAFGVIFSSVFLGEQITLANVASIALVIGGIYFLRKKLSEDDTDEEKVSMITCDSGINAERRTKQNANVNRSFQVKLCSIYTKNKVKLAKISKLVSKVVRMLRQWFLYQKINTFEVFPNKPNVYKYYLGKGITKSIFYKKDSSYVKWKSKKFSCDRKFSKLLLASNTYGG